MVLIQNGREGIERGRRHERECVRAVRKENRIGVVWRDLDWAKHGFYLNMD